MANSDVAVDMNAVKDKVLQPVDPFCRPLEQVSKLTVQLDNPLVDASCFHVVNSR